MSKILYITPHLSTGGLPQYLYKKIEVVSNVNNDISLIEWEDQAPIYRVQKDLIKKVINKSNFVSWEQGTSVEIKIKHIKNFIRDSNFDIIHIEEFPEFFLPTELIDYIYKTTERSYKIIETSHNSGFPVEDKQVFPDAFVFVSQHQIEKFKQFNVPSYLAEYPIDRKIRSNREEALIKLNLDPEYKHVLNVGLFTPGKNQSYAFKIAQLLEIEKIQFHFIGNQAGNFKDYWEPLMQNKPSNCIIHGERSDVNNWYNDCDLLLFTSTSELNPLVPREALSWDLPVLMNDLDIYQREYDLYVNYLTNDLFKDSNIVKKILDLPFEDVVGDELPNIIRSTEILDQTDSFINIFNEVYNNTKIRIDSHLNKQIKINFNFFNGPFAEVLGGDPSIKYNIAFHDEEDRIIHQNTLLPNHYTLCYRKWFTNWTIKIKSKDELIFEHKFNLKGKRVLISFESSSLGDTIAWIPYVEEFRLKHDCEVICSTFWNNLYQNSYPKIKFIKPGKIVENMYASYKLGCFNPPDDQKWHPSDWRKGSLQKAASDILGLEYKEIRTKIDVSNSKRPLKEKYVCISIHSSAQCKYWNTPSGWQKTVDYLNKQGYTVVNIAKEVGTYMGNKPLRGVLDRSGDVPIEERIKYLKHSEFFIGISSGLAWVSWALGKPTIMISGVTASFNEPSTMIKIHNDEVCNGCFNSGEYLFDKGDWNWCPKKQNFICSKAIYPETVIEKIDSLMEVEKQIDNVLVEKQIDKIETRDLPISGPKYQRLVIFTGIYNGRKYIERCIESIKKQKFGNFRCFIVDDCSLDDTVRLALKAIDGDQRFSVIVNSEKKYGLQNIYNTIHRFDVIESDIVVQVDGDDYLPDNLVFNRVIDEYNKNDVWLTYGSFQQFSDGSLVDGWAQKVDYNIVREEIDYWNVTHLKTFLVKLFRRIKRQDLLDFNNEFYKYSGDIAFMLPMVEMAGEHAKYLSEINYIYNNLNALNEYNVNSEAQLRAALEIRRKDRQSPLEKL